MTTEDIFDQSLGQLLESDPKQLDAIIAQREIQLNMLYRLREVLAKKLPDGAKPKKSAKSGTRKDGSPKKKPGRKPKVAEPVAEAVENGEAVAP